MVKSRLLKNSVLLLVGVVLLAFVLRFYKLGSIPPSLTWDEVAWGYNAYSLGENLKDEFGKFLPLLYLESFGDFKPPLYAYLTILPVKIFGLNEFATRFPSALFGSLTVLITFFLVKELFQKEHSGLPILASFLLAISPWHILLSRAAFEANVSSFLILAGLLLFLKSFKKNYYFPLSLLLFLLSMFTFNTARIVVPLLAVVLLILYFKNLFTMKKIVIPSVLVAFVLYLPLFLFLQTPQAKLRFEEVNIFSDSAVVLKANQQIENDNNAPWSKVIHNRRLAYGVSYIHHYFDNLTPNFLFFQGDGNPKFSTQDVGQLYIWEIPFLILGFIALFRTRGKGKLIVASILIIGIVPAAFARETPHALRIETTLPSFQILTALGVLTFFSSIKTLKKFYVSRIMVVFFVLIVCGNFTYFLHSYFVHYANEFSGEWQYGYKESVAYVEGVKNDYKNIYISEELGRPYIYYLFYTKYPPAEFARNARIFRETYGFVHVLSYENLHFVDDFKEAYQDRDKSLFISGPDIVPPGASTKKNFYLLNGKEVLRAYTL